MNQGRIEVVYKSDAARGAVWHRVFAAEAPELQLVDWTPGLVAPDAPYLVAWQPPDDLMRVLPGLRVLFGTGAGVDHLDLPSLPGDVALVRMVDEELTRSMVEYVLLSVLALHRDLPFYLDRQRTGEWAPLPVRRAADRRVGIMGLGVLGRACAEALRDRHFDVRGWSATAKDIPGIATFAGESGLSAFLEGTDILVCLLPLTDETRGILNAGLFAALPPGTALVNAGRGGHLCEADLLAALANGHLRAAVLDVLAQEPPPPDHPLMRHPRVLVTPHVASYTQPETAARQVIRAIGQHRRGEAMDNRVDRRQGY